MADKSKRRRRLINKDFETTKTVSSDIVKREEPMSRTKSLGRKLQCEFSIDDAQVFSVSYKRGDIITLYVDADGTIYPEKYAHALEKGILIKKEDV